MTPDGAHSESGWTALRERLRERGLWSAQASLSLRCPGSDACWWGEGDAAPQRIAIAADAAAAPHAAIYALRADVGAIHVGGGRAGQALAAAGLVMPQLFDEQARHLGVGAAADGAAGLAAALRTRGQCLVFAGRPVCLAPTAQRLALNAELAEKCATAFLLADAAGSMPAALPWWVRLVANRRLHRDGRRAAARFAAGLMPEESKGY